MADNSSGNQGTLIFGVDRETSARIFMPEGAATWKIGDIVDNKTKNMFLSDFSLVDFEQVDAKQCFNDVTHLFAFGRNGQSCRMMVRCGMFVGDKCKGGKEEQGQGQTDATTKTIAQLRKAYDENRVFKKKEPIAIQISGSSSASDGIDIKGYLVSMDISVGNPAAKLMFVTFSFIVDQEA